MKSRRESWMVSSSSGKWGSRVKHWQVAVVSKAAGWAATGTGLAARISRRSGSMTMGPCSQLAPTANRTVVGHGACAFGGREAVGAGIGEGAGSSWWRRRRGRRRRRSRGRPSYLGEVEEGLEDQEVDAGVLEEADLFGDVVARALPRDSMPSRSMSWVRETDPATRAWLPATSRARRTAAALMASVWAP